VTEVAFRDYGTMRERRAPGAACRPAAGGWVGPRSWARRAARSSRGSRGRPHGTTAISNQGASRC